MPSYSGRIRGLLTALLVVGLGSCSTYLDKVPGPDRRVKPDGKGWHCTIEPAGMLSVCERTRKECRKARKFLQKRLENRGENVGFSPCVKQKIAYCYTAKRRVLAEQTDVVEDVEDEAADEDTEEDEDSEDEEDEEDDKDRGSDDGDKQKLVTEKVWLCHDTPNNCEANRLNMYQDGFTDVSLCKPWK